jgi:hypothetical protein
MPLLLPLVPPPLLLLRPLLLPLPLLLLPLLPVLLQAGTITINFRLLPGDTSATIHQHLLHWLGPDAQHADIAFTDKWETPAAVTDPHGPHFALVRDAIQEAWRLKGQPREDAAQGDKHHAATAAVGLQASDDREEQQQQQQQRKQKQDISSKSGKTSSSDASIKARQLPVIPYLLSGGTDSKWYANLTSNIVRFAPFSVIRRAGDLKRVHGTDERLLMGDFGRMLCTFRAGMRMAGTHMHLGSMALLSVTAEAAAAEAEAELLHMAAVLDSSRPVNDAAAGSAARAEQASSSSSRIAPDEL